MKRLFPLFIMISVTLSLSAQTIDDAVNYSVINPTGTARTTAMGGSFGALGGDFSSVISNPAGLGVFRSSELTFTTNMFFNGMESEYYGGSAIDNKFNMGITQFGVVAPIKTSGRKLTGGAFSFGANTLKDFSGNIFINGYGVNSSFADPFVESANTSYYGDPELPYYLNSYDEKMFFDGSILAWNESDGTYFLNRDMRDSTGAISLDQFNEISRYGSIDEWSVALGLNYGNKLYLGFSANLNTINFKEESVFSERDPSSGVEFYDYYDTRLVDGMGLGAKIGAIYRPIKMLRLGFAIHTPTVYYITENRYSELTTCYIGDTILVPIYPDGLEKLDSVATYSIKTPARYMASAAVMFGKFLIVSADMELIDYSRIRMRADNIDTEFTTENVNIQNEMSYTTNLRAGAELKLGRLYMRAGMSYLGSPYSAGNSHPLSYHMNYSGGIGVRLNHYFFDLAATYQNNSFTRVLYDSPYVAGVSAATVDSHTLQVMATFGVRFK
jgi:hypothetical protein